MFLPKRHTTCLQILPVQLHLPSKSIGMISFAAVNDCLEVFDYFNRLLNLENRCTSESPELSSKGHCRNDLPLGCVFAGFSECRNPTNPAVVGWCGSLEQERERGGFCQQRSRKCGSQAFGLHF